MRAICQETALDVPLSLTPISTALWDLAYASIFKFLSQTCRTGALEMTRGVICLIY